MIWHVLIIAVVFIGWQLFPDGPLAYYMLTGLLIGWLCLQIAAHKGGRWWAVYGLGAGVGFLATTCGGLYAIKADARAFLCDKGTGLPVSLFIGLAAIAVAVYVLRDKS